MSNSNIVDRVVERLKTQPVGDLITEEDLYDIVKEAIPKAFFEKRKVASSRGYGSDDVDPLIYEIMREVLQKEVKGIVDKWVTENGQMMLDYWKEVTDANLLNYVQKIQDERSTGQVKKMLESLLNQLNMERQKMGLGYLYL